MDFTQKVYNFTDGAFSSLDTIDVFMHQIERELEFLSDELEDIEFLAKQQDSKLPEPVKV